LKEGGEGRGGRGKLPAFRFFVLDERMGPKKGEEGRRKGKEEGKKGGKGGKKGGEGGRGLGSCNLVPALKKDGPGRKREGKKKGDLKNLCCPASLHNWYLSIKTHRTSWEDARSEGEERKRKGGKIERNNNN